MKSLVTIYKNPEKRGGIVNKKSYQVPIEQLYVEEGFNVRTVDFDHIKSIAASYENGDYVPPLVVEVQEDLRMKIVDGHHRYQAILMLIEKGLEFKRVQCESFLGGKVDQVAFMIKSSQGRNLSVVDRANAYKRLEMFGNTPKEIAEKVGRSDSDVSKHLSIAYMPDSIKALIQNNSISAWLALELYNSGGEMKVIREVNRVYKEGKKKVTKARVTSFKASMGKNVVSALSSVEVENVGSDVCLKIPADKWQIIEGAINALESDKR